MRGDIVYRVYGVHEGRDRDLHFGTFRTEPTLKWRSRNSRREKAAIRRRGITTKGSPSAKLRWRLTWRSRRNPSRGTQAVGTSTRSKSRKLARVEPGRPSGRCPSSRPGLGQPREDLQLERRYSMIHTFEPFHQGDKEFALVSRNYTSTDVLDLRTGT
jgi:hypothetical protein